MNKLKSFYRRIPFKKLKLAVKYLFSLAAFIISKKLPRKILYGNKLTSFSLDNQESFFGYYDKTPENHSGRFVLFHSTTLKTKSKPNANVPITICLFDKETNETAIISKSNLYNWQQGCRLQWLNNNCFIWNELSEDGMINSCAYNVLTKEKKYYSLPIQESIGDKHILSIDYIKLNRVRPDYGYRIGNNTISEYGIIKLNLTNNSYEEILTLEDVQRELSSISNLKDYWINHLMASPDSKKFLFTMRWCKKGEHRTDRLYVYYLDSKKMRRIGDDGIISHYNWLNKNEFVAFMKYKGELNFFKVNLNNLSSDIQNLNISNFDGHPSLFSTNRIVIDTYPGFNRHKVLKIIDLQSGESQFIGSFYEGLNYFGETRCDLHPRAFGNSVYFDSVHSGKRKMYKLKIMK